MLEVRPPLGISVDAQEVQLAAPGDGVVRPADAPAAEPRPAAAARPCWPTSPCRTAPRRPSRCPPTRCRCSRCRSAAASTRSPSPGVGLARPASRPGTCRPQPSASATSASRPGGRDDPAAHPGTMGAMSQTRSVPGGLRAGLLHPLVFRPVVMSKFVLTGALVGADPPRPRQPDGPRRRPDPGRPGARLRRSPWPCTSPSTASGSSPPTRATRCTSAARGARYLATAALSYALHRDRGRGAARRDSACPSWPSSSSRPGRWPA